MLAGCNSDGKEEGGRRKIVFVAPFFFFSDCFFNLFFNFV
jgi:hypothetical protein